MTKQIEDKFIVRMPPGMRAVVKYRAAQSRRSMNSEILLMIERALRGEEAAGTSPEKANPAANRHSALQGAATTNG